MASFRILITLFFLTCCYADDLPTLAHDFWTWRAAMQPFSMDDIPRIERPPDALPDWSAGAMDARRRALADFESRWKGLDPRHGSIAEQVDYRLIGSAIARVHWELDLERGWQRNPG